MAIEAARGGFNLMIFTQSSSRVVERATHSLGQQAAVLRCAVAGLPVTSVPVILDMDDKHVFRLSSNLESARSQHVRQQEKKIKFGARHASADVEADEVDLGKEVDMSKRAAWEQWGGIVERGHPKSLVHTSAIARSSSTQMGPERISCHCQRSCMTTEVKLLGSSLATPS